MNNSLVKEITSKFFILILIISGVLTQPMINKFVSINRYCHMCEKIVSFMKSRPESALSSSRFCNIYDSLDDKYECGYISSLVKEYIDEDQEVEDDESICTKIQKCHRNFRKPQSSYRRQSFHNGLKHRKILLPAAQSSIMSATGTSEKSPIMKEESPLREVIQDDIDESEYDSMMKQYRKAFKHNSNDPVEVSVSDSKLPVSEHRHGKFAKDAEFSKSHRKYLAELYRHRKLKRRYPFKIAHQSNNPITLELVSQVDGSRDSYKNHMRVLHDLIDGTKQELRNQGYNEFEVDVVTKTENPNSQYVNSSKSLLEYLSDERIYIFMILSQGAIILYVLMKMTKLLQENQQEDAENLSFRKSEKSMPYPTPEITSRSTKSNVDKVIRV